MKPFDPPFTDLDTEQALLGALIKKSGLISDLEISPDHFFYTPHQLLFAEMKKLFAENKGFGIPELNAWAEVAKEQNDSSFIGGMTGKEYIRSLWDTFIPAGPLICSDWAFRITDLYRKRIIDVALTQARMMMDSNESGTVLAQLHRTISDNSTIPAVRSQAQVHAAIREGLALPPNRYATGFKHLDKILGGGLYAGFTYGFCGAEKAGKTTMAHSISYQLDCNHLYVAMEMGGTQIEQRNIAREAGINSLMFLENPSLCQQAIKNIIPRKNINYLDCPGASCDELFYNISGSIIKLGIKGFIIDYWQLIGGRQRGDSEEYHLRDSAQKIANFARKNGLWCIILAQMNKGGELFGGNGLKKACDMLFMIEEADADDCRYLKMDASRYTPKSDVGSAGEPGFGLDIRRGPHFYDPNSSKMFERQS